MSHWATEIKKASAHTRREFLKTALSAGVTLPGIRTGFGGDARPCAPTAAMETRKLLRWQTHLVARIPHGYQVAVADVNGDGRRDILALSSGENIVEWYENPTWKRHPITTKTQHNISLAPLRRKVGGGCGIALATDFSLEDSTRGGNVWWVEPANSPESEWPLRPIAQIPTSHRLRWADLDGDGRPELVDAPLLGSGAKPPEYSVGAPLTWFEMPESALHGPPLGEGQRHASWTSHLVDDSLTVVHGIQILDWDNDGRDEILTASFDGIHLFHSSGRGKDLRWTKHQLGAGDQASRPRRGSSEIGVGKLAGRRFLATIEPWHGERMVVYFEQEGTALWKRQVIDDSFHDGHALACADLDGDGNDEVVAGFRSVGTSLYVYYSINASGTKWERQTLDTDMAASGVVIDDLNGDGRPDVVAIGASSGNVKWYENLGDRTQVISP